jgi:hypothetical protein
MKQIFLDNLCLHSTEFPNPFFISPSILGMGFPEIRTVEFNRAGQDGNYVSSQYFGPRTIKISGYLTSNDIVSFETQRRAYLANCSPVKDSSGILLPRILRVKDMNSDWRIISVQVIDSSLDPNNLLSGTFKLTLRTIDVAWQDDNLISTPISTLRRGGVVIPSILASVFSLGTGGLQTVVNSGDMPSFPIIALNGPLTNPLIQNQTTGNLMKLNMTIDSGTQVIIDMKNRTIIQGGVTNIISLKSSDSTFFPIMPGSNTILVSTDISGESGNVVVQYRNNWIGI